MRARNVEPTPEFVELSLGPLIADVRAHRSYRRLEPVRLPCPITVLGWTDDDQIPPAQLEGWSDYGDTRKVVLPGTHWSFLAAPQRLQEHIAQAMDDALTHETRAARHSSLTPVATQWSPWPSYTSP